MSAQGRAFAADGARRVAAIICLAGVYQAAVTNFDWRWIALSLIGAAGLATAPADWVALTDSPPPWRWPHPIRAWFHLVPGWLGMAAAAGLKWLGYRPLTVLAAWAAGGIALLGGAYALGRDLPAAEPRDSRRAVWAAGLTVFIIAAFLRLWALDTIPRYVHCDEGTTVMIGQAFFDDPNRDWFGAVVAGSYTTMSFCYVLVSWGVQLLGFNLLGARLPDAIFGILSVALLFDGVRRVSSLRVAAVAALLLAANHCHVHYSRIASSYIQTAFVVTLVFALWARLWARPTPLNAVLLGLATALGGQTYRASAVTLPLLGLSMLFMLWRAPRRLIGPVLVFGLTLATAMAPFGVALWQQGPEMFGRARELNILSDTMLPGLKAQIYHTDSTAEVVLRQAWLALRGFHAGRDHQPQYSIHLPMADRYSAALMIPGAALALLTLRQFLPHLALLFTGGYLLFGLGMQWAPGYNRTTGALPLGMVLPALAIVQSAAALWRGRGFAAQSARTLTLIGISALCVAANAHIYLVDYGLSRTFGDIDSEAGWAAREYADQYTVHLVNWPLYGHEGLRLIVADLAIPWHNEREDTVRYVTTTAVTSSDLFVLLEQDTAARDALLARFPDARVEQWVRHPLWGPKLSLVFVGEPVR